MKKEYIKPMTMGVAIKSRCHLLAGTLQSIGGNVFNNPTVTGSNGTARGRIYDDWDED